MTPGYHDVLVRATDDNDNTLERSVRVQTAMMSSAYIDNAERVEIVGPVSVRGKNAIAIDELAVDGKRYRLELAWIKETQKWDIQYIEER